MLTSEHRWTAAALLGLLLGSASPLAATVFQVNSIVDLDDAAPDGVCETSLGNHQCTLRAAVEEANNDPGLPPVVFVPPGSYSLSLGELAVTRGMTIQGAGRGVTIVQRQVGADEFRFIRHSSQGLALEDMTVRGFALSPLLDPFGAAVYSTANLTIRRCAFDHNMAREGGAVSYRGGSGESLLIEDSVFTANTGQFAGGDLQVCGDFTVRSSIFAGGSAAGSGGAIQVGANETSILLYCWGTGTVDSSYIAGETATNGGGLAVIDSTLRLLNSTVSNNAATNDGGGIYAELAGSLASTQLYVLNSTLTLNRADSDLDAHGQGGGIFAKPGFRGSPAPIVEIANSILAGNNGTVTITNPIPSIRPWPQDCSGAVTSNGYNIVRGNDQGFCLLTGATSAADPMLQAAGYNGGPTPTHALPPGSPAIDAGDPNGCRDEQNILVTVDQRGVGRPYGAHCDLGTYEYAPLVFRDGFEVDGNGRWSAATP